MLEVVSFGSFTEGIRRTVWESHPGSCAAGTSLEATLFGGLWKEAGTQRGSIEGRMLEVVFFGSSRKVFETRCGRAERIGGAKAGH
jgi:hypothetical protein